MKIFLIKLSLTLLVIATLIGIERLSHFLTDDFSYSNITSNLQRPCEWDVAIDERDWTETDKALDQPYTYLESGSQSCVFISEDKKYILNFICKV